MPKSHVAREGKYQEHFSPLTYSGYVSSGSAANTLRDLYESIPASMVVTLQPPRIMTEEDLRENYFFKGNGQQDPVALMSRVCEGVKPMATILMQCPKRRHIPENAVAMATRRLRVGCQVYYGRTGRREAVVYQPSVTLAHYWNPDEVIAAYAKINLQLPRDIFEAPLMRYGRGLVNEQFPGELRLPLMGLCFGYPVSETIDMVLSTRLLEAREREQPGRRVLLKSVMRELELQASAQGGQDVLLGHAEHAVEGVGRDGVGV